MKALSFRHRKNSRKKDAVVPPVTIMLAGAVPSPQVQAVRLAAWVGHYLDRYRPLPYVLRL